MISSRLQIFAIILVIIFLAIQVVLLKRNRMTLKYSLLWLLSGVILLVLAIFPALLDGFAALMGVYSSVNALFAVIIFCGTALMISFTVIISRQRAEIVRLAQTVAILDNRLRALENPREQAFGEERK